MPEISELELEEFRLLRKRYGQDAIRESIRSLVCVRDDIDEPIRKCVAAFALLGCQPIWSCCGFDYKGQPLHKSHRYGRIFFILMNASHSESVFNRWGMDDWKLLKNEPGFSFHIDFKNIIPQWDTPSYIHYSETPAIHVQVLEEFLFGLSDEFMQEVTLEDTNLHYRTQFTYWQYPILEPWVIRKSDIM